MVILGRINSLLYKSPCDTTSPSFRHTAQLSSGRSAVWSAHLPWEQGAGGSNPPVPTSYSPQCGLGKRTSHVGWSFFCHRLPFTHCLQPQGPQGRSSNLQPHAPPISARTTQTPQVPYLLDWLWKVQTFFWHSSQFPLGKVSIAFSLQTLQ